MNSNAVLVLMLVSAGFGGLIGGFLVHLWHAFFPVDHLPPDDSGS